MKAIDLEKGNTWAEGVYKKKLENPATLPNLGKGFSNELRAARAVQHIAERKLYARGSRVLLPLLPYERGFWRGVLDKANVLVLAAPENQMLEA